MNLQRTVILMPAFDDWESLYPLLSDIKLQNNISHIGDYSILVVNDFSQIKANSESIVKIDIPVRILHLRKNLGHQRAIATGLCYVYENMNVDHVIVMDSDGEDKPGDIPSLYDQSIKQNKIVFAKRAKRSESNLFKLFYKIYKTIFRLFVGKKMEFGNFSVLPFDSLEALVYDSNLWNNYSAAIMRSRLAYTSLPTQRGKRYSGKSQMNFISLITHGFSSISVYSDIVSTRLIILSALITLVTFTSIILVAIIRFFTHFAVPGWATYSILAMTIILFQALFLGIFALFIFLSSRSNRSIIPLKEHANFISSVEILNDHD